MDARSTAARYVHFGGDVVAGVEGGIGVRLGYGSTGAQSIVEPISDSDTAAMIVRAKGAATLTIGNSSNALNFAGTISAFGAGSAPKGFYSTTWAYEYTALSSGAMLDISIASTTADIQPGDLVTVSLGEPTVPGIALMNVRYSTAAASRVTLTIGNITSTALASTGSGTGRITWVDLT